MQKTRISIVISLALVGLAGGQSFSHAGLTAPSPMLQAEPDAAAAATSEPAAAEPAAAEASTPSASAFSTAQLEQLVAPIALYPDALLMQILMASTYPLEVVEADRYVKKNPEVKDEALDEALKEKDWDPSVKSLCKLPDVLKQMSENLDWTQDLGDAVLGQKNELMDTVQKMRGLAYDAGNLESTEQQTVTQQEDKIIVIESSDPEVVYVPSYSPTVVYAGWGYPSYYYPPMYPYYPPGYGFISFSFGVAMGAAIWGGCNWGWGHSDIDIDINRYNEFNRNTDLDFDRNRIDQRGSRDGKANWQHDSSHRKGVNYRDSNVAQQFGGREGSSRVTRDQARGRATASTGARTPSASNRALNRDVASPRTSNAATGLSNRSGSGARSSNYDFNRSSSNRSSALSGSRSPSIDRRSSYRGASSRGTRSFGGSRGGGRPRRR